MGETTILGAKLVKISHIRKRETHFFNKKSYFISFSSPYPFSSPFVCHLLATYLHRNLIGTSSESHRNLIGISPNDERIIKQLPTIFKQLSFYNSSTTLDGVPSRVSRFPNTLDLHSSIPQGTLCPLSSGVPENARGVLGCLTNVIRVYPASNLSPHHLITSSPNSLFGQS